LIHPKKDPTDPNSTISEDEYTASHEEEAARRAKNEAAIRLLDKWLADESGYDEDVWPRVKVAIEENRLSERKRFSD
jgi:hypothetical protein